MTATRTTTNTYFRVLGPLEVSSEGIELRTGGPKQRLVLAMLLAAAGRSVSSSALIDGLWGEDPPATAKKTLQGYVHHLRSAIGEVLRTEAGGYSLRTSDANVDERQFAIATAEARAMLDDEPAEASLRLEKALGMWHGSAYADLDGEPALVPEITRLHELRVAALADRIDADLRLGRHEALVGELESLALEYPLRERFRAQHMLALYRSGRHGEALRAFARTRHYLVEEMGLSPSDELVALESAILAQDSLLDLEVVEDSSPALKAVRGYELRDATTVDARGTVYRAYQRAVGREVMVRVLESPLVNEPVFVGRFAADTARLEKVDSPYVVRIQDTWREPGRFYQITEWVAGGRLSDRLATTRLREPAALGIVGNIADALSAAHEVDVVHGDVRAESVLVDEGGTAHLTDFVVGVPAGSIRDDVISLVELAHVLLLDTEAEVQDGRYKPPPGCPEPVAAAFRSAIEQPDVRADQFVQRLHRAFGTDGVALSPAGQELTELRNPYKGLRAFEIADAGDFFGRTELVDRLADGVRRARLVAAVGPSGSGKSSAVRAGLIPRLQEESAPPLVAEMFPGAYPFEELEGALARIAVSGAPIVERLLADERGLRRVLKEILPADTELLLVIDQFEELFSMVASEETRALFLASIVAAVNDPRSKLRVVLSMRADFFARPLEYPEFGALVEEGLVPVAMPDTDGLAAAVQGPADRVGLQLQPGLVAEMVREVSEQPGSLPLLQHALSELFTRRITDTLTLDTYRAIGGASGALAARAEELFADLPPAGQEGLRQGLLRLVTVSDGSSYVRRRVRRSELDALEVDRAALDDALRRFGNHRLLTFDADRVSRQPTVEVAHEALLREWPRVRGWLEEQREDLVFRRRLDAAVDEWRNAGEDPEYLPAGNRLAEFDGWAARSSLALSIEERAFLEAGRERAETQAHRLAARRRRVVAVLSVAAVVAASFGIYALIQRSDASDAAFEAETARLASEAAFRAGSDPQTALLMAVEAHGRDDGLVGLGALQRALVGVDPYQGVVGSGLPYREVHWVTDDALLGVSGEEVHLFRPSDGQVDVLDVTVDPARLVVEVAVESRPPRSGIRASSPSGFAAIADVEGRLFVVDTRTGGMREFGPGVDSRAAAISTDGRLIAIGHPDGRLELFDLETEVELAATQANPSRTAADVSLGDGIYLNVPDTELEGVSWLRFAPDDSTIVSSGGVFLRGWDVDGMVPIGPEIVNSWGVYDEFQYAHEPRYFWFEDADTDVVVVAGDIFVSRWRLSTGERLSLGTIPTGRNDAEQSGSVGGFAGGSDGGVIALLSDGRVIDVGTDELTPGAISRPAPQRVVMDSNRTDTNALSLSPDRLRFAVASSDGIVLGSVDGRNLLARSVPIGLSVQPSLSTDGRVLAAGLVEEGLFDLSVNPPTPVDFAVELPQSDFESTQGVFRFLSTGGADRLLRSSEFLAHQEVFEFPSGVQLENRFGAAVLPSFTTDGGLVAYARSFEESVVERLATGQVVYTTRGMARTASFDDANGRVLLSFVVPRPASVTFAPGGATLVELSSGETTELPAMPGGIAAAAFTPDATKVVAVGGRGHIWLLDAEDLGQLRQFDPAGPATEALAQTPVFSDDGTWMFSAADGVARVWHVPTGRLLGDPFPSQPGGVPFAIPAGDGLQIVTAHEGNALVWEFQPDEWAEIACRAAGRNLTESEWGLVGPRDTSHRATCAQYPLVAAPEEGVDAESAVEPATLPGLGTTVTVGRADWASGYLQAAIYSALLEELGYTVNDAALNEQSPTDAYVSMAQGSLDFWPNGWYPQHQIHHDRVLDDGMRLGDELVVLGQELPSAGLQGLVVTKSVAEEHDITSLAQINDDPELVELFDADGDGLGEIWGCPESWTCDGVIDEMLAKNGWTNLEQHKEESFGDMFESALARVEAGQGAIQYVWSPSGYLARTVPGENVLWLSIGAQEFALDGSTDSGLVYDDAAPARLGGQCSADPCWLGWYVEDIRVTANRDFVEANPAAVALFEVVRLDPLDIAAQNNRFDLGANTEADVRAEAEAWIADNRPIVDEWLAYALGASSVS